MKHIAGKIAFFSLLNILIFHMYANVSITMELADKYGKAIQEVAVGIPFQLRVVIKGQNTTGTNPYVEHPQDLVCNRSGIQMHSINGHATTVYVYTAIASVAKQYTVGPATVSLNGSLLKADSITFDAVMPSQENTESVSSRRTKEDGLSKPFMECTIDKSELFVGETVPCTLRFYCPSHIQRVSLKQIQAPQFKDVVFTQKEGQKEGIELIKQKPFKYIEWSFDVQFLKDGNMVLPPFNGEYIVEDENENLLFGGFSIFFQHNKLKKAKSNALAITVKAVPDFKGQPVVAVGSFTDFKAAVTPAAIAVGDAAVFSLQLVGNGNLSMIHHPSLTNMPTQVKVYESQSRMHPLSRYGEKIKSFEYIVQAVEDGDINIPKQKFVFFDPIKKKHFVLKTEQLVLKVKAVEEKMVVADSNHKDDQKNERHVSEGKMAQEKIVHAAIMDPIAFLGSSSWHIPLTYNQLLFLLILPLLFMICYLISMIGIVWVYRIVKYRYAYFNARRALKKLEQNNDTTSVLMVFKRYVAARRSLIITSEDDQFLTIVFNILHDKKLINEWKDFYALLIQAAYAHAQDMYVDNSFWQHTYYWLHLLKKKGL